MIDDTSSSQRTKFVTHKKYKFRRFDPGPEETVNTVNAYRYKTSGPDAYYWSWGDVHGQVEPDDVSASYAKSVNELKLQAMHNFNSFNEVDTLLNLVESGDILPAANSILTLAKRQRGSLSGNIANAWLGWSFGLAPLVADMKKIHSAIRSIKADMDSYIRNYKRGRTMVARSGGTVSVTTPPDLVWSSMPDGGTNGAYWNTKVETLSSPVRIVGVKGKREVVYNTELFKKLDYIISRFIATGPVSFGWERVKFSFIADWFVNLTGIVDALDGVLSGTRFGIDDIWLSEKYDVLVAGYKNVNSGVWTTTFDNGSYQISDAEISYYHREPLSLDIPIGASGRFGKKQASLLAALLHNFVANLRRL